MFPVFKGFSFINRKMSEWGLKKLCSGYFYKIYFFFFG